MHDHRISGFAASFHVITCSSTRTVENDDSGRGIIDVIREKGHRISGYEIVDDDMELIRKAVISGLESSDAVIITGGTGITSRDVTIEAVRGIADYEMTGFGHVFALISFQKIGASAIMSRSAAFIVKRKPVFCLPGSPDGSILAVSSLILDQIDHIHHELGR
ncbi:MAG: molybdenum cofactor biosynthesis protein B [Thermoplasmataceae archaeon]